MMWNFLSHSIGYVLPALVVGIVTWSMAKNFLAEEAKKRELDLRIRAKKDIMPNQLQAYERMALLLERIKPSALVSRLDLLDDIDVYEHSLIKNINHEYEHNLAQQIYVHPDTWKLIFAAKNATQSFIRECRLALPPQSSGKDLRNKILESSMHESSPSSDALLRLQKDIQGV